jgi:hypothetical protein
LLFYKSMYKLIKTQLLFAIINRRIKEFISLQFLKQALNAVFTLSYFIGYVSRFN